MTLIDTLHYLQVPSSHATMSGKQQVSLPPAEVRHSYPVLQAPSAQHISPSPRQSPRLHVGAVLGQHPSFKQFESSGQHLVGH